MSFIDTLRAARQSKVAVLHEFWTQYDPNALRVYSFFEGQDDIAFFMPHIERFLPPGFRILHYRCEGKPRVMEVFGEITRRIPDIRLTLFFVDKDLDDILGTPWPTDPRIFVTDVYSIENYLVSAAVMMKFYRDSVRLNGVAFDESVIEQLFESQLRHFQKRMLCVMAWILLVRRAGGRPNLNNIQMNDILYFSHPTGLRPRRGERLSVLVRQTGATFGPIGLARLRRTTRELARVPFDRIVRGRFSAWFFLSFWNNLIGHLQTVAKEGGGKLSVKIPLTETSFVGVLASYVPTPRSLELFLKAHFSAPARMPSPKPEANRDLSLWRRLMLGLRR